MPHSGDPEHNMWLTGIAVSPEDPALALVSGGNYVLPHGPGDVYLWKTTDHGRNWSHPQLLISGSAAVRDHDCPHIRFGTSGYVFAYFQRDTVVDFDTLSWPYYIESTDNGRTWIPHNGRCMLTAVPYPQWSSGWYNYDCEVVDNVPYVVVSPGIPGNHRDRVEFWKASGQVGNRTWTMSVLAGLTPPGADSARLEVSIVTGKDFARFQDVIAVVAQTITPAEADPRGWVSNDAGATWRYLGCLLNEPMIYEVALECAHVPGRGFQPETDILLHIAYISRSRLYYAGFNVAGVGVPASSGAICRRPHLETTPNPCRGRLRIRLAGAENSMMLCGRLRPRVCIYDPSGRLVRVATMSGPTCVIDIGQPGVYYIVVAVGERVLTKKVVIL